MWQWPAKDMTSLNAHDDMLKTISLGSRPLFASFMEPLQIAFARMCYKMDGVQCKQMEKKILQQWDGKIYIFSKFFVAA